MRPGLASINWTKLDRTVQEYQTAGFNLWLVLKSSSNWATVKPLGQASSPPKEEYWDNYSAWVEKVIRRYQGKVDYYEIESEAQHQGFWLGTTEEYLDLLKTAYQSAKSISPEIKIVLSGINLGDIFDDESNTNITDPRAIRALEFIKKTLRSDYYDIVEFHYNHDYSGVYGTVNWLKEHMPKDKPIWAGDAASAPFKPQGNLRQEQSDLAIKKIVSAMHAGVQGIMLCCSMDWPNYHLARWRYQGIINNDQSPRPAFNSLKLIKEKLKDASTIEKIDIHTYRFKTPKGPVTVLWHNNESPIIY